MGKDLHGGEARRPPCRQRMRREAWPERTGEARRDRGPVPWECGGMSLWRTATMDVEVDWDDVEKAREFEIDQGREVRILTVPAEVDIDEALEQATVEQLR